MSIRLGHPVQSTATSATRFDVAVNEIFTHNDEAQIEAAKHTWTYTTPV
ncbi:hypothetical protein [Haloglycomyces albus]|nr:hypothetical protein [Haloglycomyces albus]